MTNTPMVPDLTPTARAEQIVWDWQRQFPYKLNISHDKLEELQQQFNAVIRAVEQAPWEAAFKLTLPCDCVMRGSYGCRCDYLRKEFRRRSNDAS